MVQEQGGRGNETSGRGAGMRRRARIGGGGRCGMGRRGGGPPDECVCPQCGTRVPRQRGVPCVEQICPNCSTHMERA